MKPFTYQSQEPSAEIRSSAHGKSVSIISPPAPRIAANTLVTSFLRSPATKSQQRLRGRPNLVPLRATFELRYRV